jgi:hypothetical protein
MEEVKSTPEVTEESESSEGLGEIDVAFATDHDYIQSAYFALASIQDIDTMILNKADETRVKRIRRQSLRIISECLNTLYDEIFEDPETTEPEKNEY